MKAEGWDLSAGWMAEEAVDARDLGGEGDMTARD